MGVIPLRQHILRVSAGRFIEPAIKGQRGEPFRQDLFHLRKVRNDPIGIHPHLPCRLKGVRPRFVDHIEEGGLVFGEDILLRRGTGTEPEADYERNDRCCYGMDYLHVSPVRA